MTDSWEKGWRAGVEAFAEAIERGASTRPAYTGTKGIDPQLASRSPIEAAVDAQEFGGFLQGWLKAEDEVHAAIRALLEGGPRRP